MTKMDYSKLRGKIRELGKTEKRVAEYAGISASTFSQKLNGHFAFTQKEMHLIMEFLSIPATEVHTYFFTQKV